MKYKNLERCMLWATLVGEREVKRFIKEYCYWKSQQERPLEELTEREFFKILDRING